MADAVLEGDYKNFTFKKIGTEALPEISHHLRTNFHIDEPLSILIGNSEPKFRDLDNFIEEILNDGLSSVAVDKDTGKIAGVSIIYRHKKEEDGVIPPDLESDEMKITLGFIAAVDKEANLFEHFGIEEIADYFIASVDKEFRGKGLASEMYRRNIAFLKELNFVAVTSAFTSPYTRLIGKKFEFVELAKRYYRELQDLKGELICPEAGDDEYISVTALKL